MANSTLLGVNTNNITLPPITQPTSSTYDLINIYNATVTDASNNYPVNSGSTSYVAPVTQPPITVVDTLVSRTSSVTYETIYKNLASYPYTVDNTVTKVLTKVYTLSDATTITVVTDMTTHDVIVQTITGNTGYIKSLIKTTNIQRDVNNKISNIIVNYTMV